MSTKTILLVEDNPSDVDLTKRALSKGHILNELVVAEDGREALDYLFGAGQYAGRDTRNIPAVVLPDATRRIPDGAAVKIDGGRGTVELVTAER